MPGLPKSPKLRRGALAAMLLAGTALGGFAVVHAGMAATTEGAITPTLSAHGVPDFADLVAQVKPAVVSITVKLDMEQMADETSADEAGPRSFPMPHSGHPHEGRPQGAEARGSGFIIDAEGTVVTNNHVVEHAKSISVAMDDGTELPAKLIGRDPRTDVAVLRVDAGHKLPFIVLGDSDTVRPGEWVVAMGNPFGLGGTVTAGIVSARGRDIGAGPYDSFLQVDAPINQGNSGGPLFTQDGKVVGMNTAILSPTGGSIGIGFAIPANMVKTVVADLEKDGHVARGYLGVTAQPVTAEMSKALHLPHGGGALVAAVEPGSPAAKAGLVPGDVIDQVEGKPVATPRDLAVDVAAVKPGDTTKLEYVRDGEKQTASIAVGELPNEKTADRGQAGPEEHQGKVGLALAPISPEMRGKLDLPEGTKGAIVAAVRPGSPAEAAGIEAGDVVLSVGTKPVASPEEAVRAIRAASKTKDGTLALRIFRDGQASFIAVDMNKPTEG